MVFLVPISQYDVFFAPTGDWNIRWFENSYLNAMPVFTPVLLSVCLGVALRKGASLWVSQVMKPTKIILISIAVYAAFTIFWSENILHSLFQYCYLVSFMILFYLVISTMATQEIHKKMIWCLLFSCLAQALLSYVFRFMDSFVKKANIGDFQFAMSALGGMMNSDGSPVQAHGLQDGHVTSMWMNIFMAVATGLFLTEKQAGRRIFLVLCFIIGLSVLIGTESRGGAAAFVAMAMFFLFFYHRTSKYLIRSVIIFFAAFLVFYVVEQKIFSTLAGKEEAIMRLLTIGQKSLETGDVLDPGLSSEGEGPGRMTIWGNGFSGLSGNWLGAGIGNYKYLYTIPHAHSVLFSFLFDLGPIGLILFLSLFYHIIKYYMKVVKLQDTYLQIMSLCLMSAFTAVMFHGCFDFDYTYAIYWLFWGFVFSTLILVNKPAG
ncbi:MAG: O-antigen ligase family protein [Nitrospirae bacterium]|nr:O-antigen ligase family protein [Nitrospirota bacterium]